MPKNSDLLIAASTIWVVITAVLVMFMQAGFAFLEAGLTRMKNAGHIAGKNVLIFGICSLVYWAVGFGLAFGDGNAIIGTAGFFPSVTAMISVGQKPFDFFAEIPGAAGYLFEVVFAGVSLAIVWGAMAERAKLWVYFVFGIWFTLTYSVVSHWIWSPHGWLFKHGMQDFAGSTVVHYQGALAGLAGALILGPRIGKFGTDGRANPIPGHNIPYAVLGHADPLVRLVRVQPGLDALGRLRRLRLLRVRRPDHEHRRRRRGGHRHVRRVGQARQAGHLDDAQRRAGRSGGDHRGLGLRRAWAAIVIGVGSGFIAVFGVIFVERIGIDDPIGAVAVHGFSGVWGTLATGLFAVPLLAKNLATGTGGLVYTGSFHQLGVQALGLVAVGVFVFATSFARAGRHAQALGYPRRAARRRRRARRARARHVGLPRVLHPRSGRLWHRVTQPSRERGEHQAARAAPVSATSPVES